MRRRGLTLLLTVVVLLCSCRSVVPFKNTGIGNSWDHAVFGSQDEYVRVLQFMYEKTGRELLEKFEAVQSSHPLGPDGEVDLDWAKRRFELMEALALEIKTWEEMSETVAMYEGIDLSAPADESSRAARKRARAFLKALGHGLKELADE